MTGLLSRRRLREPGFPDRLCLQRQVDQRLVVFRTGDWTDAKRLGVASGEDNPLPAPSADERTRAIDLRCRHQFRPRAMERRLNAPRQVDSSPTNTTTSKPLPSSALTIDAGVFSNAAAT